MHAGGCRVAVRNEMWLVPVHTGLGLFGPSVCDSSCQCSSRGSTGRATLPSALARTTSCAISAHTNTTNQLRNSNKTNQLWQRNSLIELKEKMTGKEYLSSIQQGNSLYITAINTEQYSSFNKEILLNTCFAVSSCFMHEGDHSICLSVWGVEQQIEDTVDYTLTAFFQQKS